MPNREFAIPLAAPDLTADDVRAVTAVLRDRTLSRGPRQAAFERRFADRLSVPHAVAVSSGSAGLHLALVVLGVAPGDEVITSPFAVPATANAIRQTGARVVFADIEAASMNLDPERVRAAMGARTKAILAVHTFGLPADLERFRTAGVPVIEDACEALGATLDGRTAGALGDLGVFGFYPNKQITTGEGGMLVTGREDLASRLRALRNHGRSGTAWLDQQEPGFNYRLSEIACALGLAQLARLDAILQRRRALAARYRDALGDEPRLHLPAEPPAGRHGWSLFVVQLAPDLPPGARDRVVEALAARGIQCGRYFAPLHRQPAAAAEDHPAFPVTEAVAARTLALPFFNRLTDTQIGTVCTALRRALDAEAPDPTAARRI